jgi:uncharacterized protein YfdQ (DUF2303 family)
MTDLTPYQDGEGADLALVADLAADLATSEADILDEGPGYAVLRSGKIVTWTKHLPAPVRRTGTVNLDTVSSFADYVLRLGGESTVVYADQSRGRFVAVLDDHPVPQVDDSAPPAGFRETTAVLPLVLSQDWQDWCNRDRKMYPQQDFGQFIDEMAHTIVTPSSATMLEIATTLTAKTKIDYGSRVNLDNGDIEFRFEEETSAKAGRGSASVEIPRTFTISVSVWNRTNPVEVDCRLRFKPEPSGVMMGFKMIRKDLSVESAFDGLHDLVLEALPDVPVYLGDGMPY